MTAPLPAVPDGFVPLFRTSPFLDLTGPYFHRPLTQGFLIGLRIAPMHTNASGTWHGGAIATLLDVGLSCAARAHDPLRYGVVTVDLTIHFIAPAAGDVICTSVCEKRGKSLSFVRGELRSEAGELLGMASGTFKLVERKITGS